MFLSTIGTICGATFLAYELQLQHSLTAPPLVFGQCCTTNNNNDKLITTRQQQQITKQTKQQQHDLDWIYQCLTATPYSILHHMIQPSLLVEHVGI